MNNAGVADKGTSWDGIDNWKKVFDVNVFGCVHQSMQQSLLMVGGCYI
jgi:NADP-dependent 3-hydroxy acid dehydrogenase YdfG